MGFLPHGFVVGSSIYEAGSQYDWTVCTQEVTSISLALRAARGLAVRRLCEQAAEVGAEGVVGVRLRVEHDVWRGARQIAKFIASGTAIGFDPTHAPEHYRTAHTLRLGNGRPFTSDLSGHEFVALLRAGFRPVSLAMGACVFGLDPRESRKYRDSDEEMAGYTQAFFDARETAMDRMQQDLFIDHPPGSVDAPIGVVGMTVTESIYGGGQSAPIVEFTAVGTAIARLAPDDPRRSAEHPRPQLTMPLDR
jgi:uncharacterized protein YbjQ (UPF0145 family)